MAYTLPIYPLAQLALAVLNTRRPSLALGAHIR